MGVGENPFTYSDESAGLRRVRVTHEWVERSISAPPGRLGSVEPDVALRAGQTEVVVAVKLQEVLEVIEQR
jgi:hypothetical protein